MSMLLSVLLSIWSLSTFSVFTATDDTDHYANGVVLTAYHQQLYCMWQSSPKDEDSPHAATKANTKPWDITTPRPFSITATYTSATPSIKKM